MGPYTSSWADSMGIQALGIAFFAVSCFASLAGAQSSSSSSSVQCFPTPISAAITNVTIANGAQNAIARGVAISVGTPPQNFAFMPSMFNNSFVYDDTNLCTVAGAITFNAESCITVRGGAYNALASKTQKPGLSDATAVDQSPYPSTSIYSDLFTLNDQTHLSNYTFGVPLNDWGEQFYTPQALLGLGTNSTLLSSLKKENLIASRSWSFFWGKSGRGQQSNGSIVFGGYDKAKVQGTTNYTRKLNYTNCIWGTAVEISTLGLIFYNAATKNLYNESTDTGVSQPLYGCIDPGGLGMAAMPYNNYFANFVIDTGYESFDNHSLGDNTIRSNGYNFWDLLYLPGDQPFLGDLNITINDGPSVRATNDQLVVPHVYLDDNTHAWEQNTSLSDLLINSLGSAGDDTPILLDLGRNFLTFVYLMINLDAGEFTLWPAYNEATDEQLVAVDENNNPIQSSALCAATAPPAPPASTSTTPHSGSSLSGGAIAGIAIGALAGIALILVGVWLFIRHRKTQDPTNAQASQPLYTDSPNHEVKSYSDMNTLSSQHAGQGHLSGQSYELPGLPNHGAHFEVEG